MYDQHHLRYLAGLRCLHTEHKALLTQWPEEQFLAFPLVSGPSPQYWGRGCAVTFKHNGQTAKHKGLVVLAGPIRDQLRHTRHTRLQALSQELSQVKAQIGQPRLRTVKAVQRRANARLKASKVGRLMSATAYQTPAGQLDLRWQIDTFPLWQAEQKDGRYLLVSNDWTLSHQRMFQLYRDKDGVEKRFHICKSDLQVSPLYLHQDQRIASMLMLNMLALLAYTLLERQTRQQGLHLTTRQLIKRLQNLTVIETHCHDGSLLRRLTPLDPDQIQEKLKTLAASMPPKPHRVRLLAAQNGDVTGQATPLAETTTQAVRFRLAPTPIASANPFLYHKTTHRQVYEAARAACPDCDEVLLWNERGEITESCIANVVVQLQGKLLTPPVQCGLLAGTFRAWLLDQKKIGEAVITLENLKRSERIYLINSVRGWREALWEEGAPR
ncbi:MAG: aminotransferase class IV [Anaerolineae bacterium]|nr:aminotransferase class IV [Anaerolineae bacterium]